MARSLAERLRAHEQQKARLAEQEAKLKTAERKARTRRLIEVGSLVDKAGLLDLDSNTLYGALLSLRDGAGDKAQLGKWEALGGRTFAREARLRDEGKEAVVLTFPAPLSKEAISADLRGAGFRFSKVLQHWEGLARFAEADALAGHMAERRGVSRRPPNNNTRPPQSPLNDRTCRIRPAAPCAARRRAALAVVAVLVCLGPLQ